MDIDWSSPNITFKWWPIVGKDPQGRSIYYDEETDSLGICEEPDASWTIPPGDLDLS